jgi:hypothetical protein
LTPKGERITNEARDTETQWLIRGWEWLRNNPADEMFFGHFCVWFARFARHEQIHPGAFAEAAKDWTWE